MLSRRAFLRLFGGTVAAGLGLLSFAFAESNFWPKITTYRLTPPRWPKLSSPLRVAVLSDIHAVEPWMSLSRIQNIVGAANELKPDLVVHLGDYVPGIPRPFRSGTVPIPEWSAALAKLHAPLGAYAVLGNHDCSTDPEGIRRALAGNGIPVFENEARKIKAASGLEFWVAGLGDQVARRDDLAKTMSAINDDAPVILLAHEPDVFPRVPERVSLTLCGHMHGGQVRLPFVGALIRPSRYGERYLYGHIVEDGRHLIVSGGLGCTFAPLRLGAPPEIVMLELG